MVSVALCTYNGEKYIAEQIYSILKQSTPVDEIIICDDGSNDNTIAILEDIKQNCSTNINILRNNSNIGVCANFELATSLCKGDIIFLSDQDDIWVKDKVETVVKWFDKHPDKSAVFTDASLIDSNGQPLMGKTLWDCVGFNKKMRHYFDNGLQLETFFINKATGATMAMRADCRFHFTQYCNNAKNVLHDYCIALKALDDSQLGYIDSPLIQYRLHNNQQAGINYQLQHPEIFSNVHRPICNIPTNFPFNNLNTQKKSLFGHKRAGFSLLQIITNVFNYIKYYKFHFLLFYIYDIAYRINIIKKATN